MKSGRYSYLAVSLAIFISLAVQLWAQTAFCCADTYGYAASGCSEQCIADCPDQPMRTEKPLDSYAADRTAEGCLSSPYTWDSLFNGTPFQNLMYRHSLQLAAASVSTAVHPQASISRTIPISALPQAWSDTFQSMRTAILLI